MRAKRPQYLAYGKSFISKDMSRFMRKPAFRICQNEGTDHMCGNRTADQRLCFHYIAQSLYFLNLKLQACSHSLWPYSPVCIGPFWKPQRQVFIATAHMFT